MQAQAVGSKPNFLKLIWRGIWYNEVENTENRDVIEEKKYVEQQEMGYTKQLAKTVGTAKILLDEKESFVEKADISESIANKRANEVREQKKLIDKDKGEQVRE